MYHGATPAYLSISVSRRLTVLPQSVVLFFFAAELFTRVIANGTIATLKKPWNAFDAFVLVLSVLLVLYKIILDYVIVQAPYPPASLPLRSRSQPHILTPRLLPSRRPRAAEHARLCGR
jgi:hypothetical protein